MTIPYAEAVSGRRARDEITRLLSAWGCAKVGFLDDFERGALTLHFEHRGRIVQIEASARGWAERWLAENPWSHRRRSGEREWKRRAWEQGAVAVNSILRDWIKGQLTAVECGLLPAAALFHMWTLDDGGRRPVDALPAPDAAALPAPE